MPGGDGHVVGRRAPPLSISAEETFPADHDDRDETCVTARFRGPVHDPGAELT